MIPKRLLAYHDPLFESEVWPHAKPDGAFALQFDCDVTRNTVSVSVEPFQRCRAGRDGESCDIDPELGMRCPQVQHGEPAATGRHCYLDHWDTDEGLNVPPKGLLITRWVRRGHRTPITSSVEVNLGAHLFGFVAGISEGWVMSRFAYRAEDAVYYYARWKEGV